MRPESERSDWTDTDLLTNDEARERLEEAVGQLKSELHTRRSDGSAAEVVAELANRLARFEKSLQQFGDR